MVYRLHSPIIVLFCNAYSQTRLKKQTYCGIIAERILFAMNRRRKMNKKAIIIVLDSVGIGELPDAAAYGDKGADTLGHIINT